MPTTVYTAEKVVEVPSYTRYSEFNQSETKLLVAGIDMGYFFDGFIKIYKFGRSKVALSILIFICSVTPCLCQHFCVTPYKFINLINACKCM